MHPGPPLESLFRIAVSLLRYLVSSVKTTLHVHAQAQSPTQKASSLRTQVRLSTSAFESRHARLPLRGPLCRHRSQCMEGTCWAHRRDHSATSLDLSVFPATEAGFIIRPLKEAAGSPARLLGQGGMERKGRGRVRLPSPSLTRYPLPDYEVMVLPTDRPKHRTWVQTFTRGCSRAPLGAPHRRESQLGRLPPSAYHTSESHWNQITEPLMSLKATCTCFALNLTLFRSAVRISQNDTSKKLK